MFTPETFGEILWGTAVLKRIIFDFMYYKIGEKLIYFRKTKLQRSMKQDSDYSRSNFNCGMGMFGKSFKEAQIWSARHDLDDILILFPWLRCIRSQEEKFTLRVQIKIIYRGFRLNDNRNIGSPCRARNLVVRPTAWNGYGMPEATRIALPLVLDGKDNEVRVDWLLAVTVTHQPTHSHDFPYTVTFADTDYRFITFEIVAAKHFNSDLSGQSSLSIKWAFIVDCV
jgi:hypothetical protein